jgi:polysaccharide deacetylase family protein (PEP-CTERM system associated)
VRLSAKPLRRTAAAEAVMERCSFPSSAQSQSAARSAGITNAMTIDVEDYFHVEAFASTIDCKDWGDLPQRVERNTDRLLEILADRNTQATFFVLGWIAQRHPGLVRRIVAEGHELASHGSDHIRVDRQSAEDFRADISRSKRVLEDTGGVVIRGYRAPTFSINRDTVWAHAILAEEGYHYSSSVYPVRHDLYGCPGAPRIAFAPVPGLIEVPLTAVRVLGVDVPASGGGYFRLFPYPVTRWLLEQASRYDRAPGVFYLHPWEIDPDQPHQRRAPLRSRFRHYLNLSLTQARLLRLLGDFRWSRMDHLFLSEAAGPIPVIPSWMDRKPPSR